MTHDPAIDALRHRARIVLDRRTEVEEACPHCKGSGRIIAGRKLTTHSAVAEIIGVTRSQFSNFLLGKSDLSFPVGLRLIAWLAENDA